MAKKEIIYQGLIELDVLIEDTSANSPNYFKITKLPGEFTAGINTFKFKGNASLFPENSPVFIEILDANGLPIYYEIGLDYESQEQSAIISIFINQDTTPGNGSITICGLANQSASGRILDPSQINVRWTTPIYIDISKQNENEIIFDELPKVTITATTGSYTNLGYPNSVRTVQESWTNIEYIYRNGEAALYTGSASNPAFPSNASNTKLTIYYGDIFDANQRPNDEVYTIAEFTSSISAYSGSGIAYLTDPILFPVNNSIEQHIVQSGLITSMDVEYEQSASLSSQTTENSYNIAIVQFSGLQPQVGEVSKIKSYYKSAGVQEYIFSNETNISNLADEFGFTSNIVTASFTLPTIHRNDKFDFKFEFINPSGYVSKQVVEYNDVLFLGGNTYIGGDDNLITGSLYVSGKTGTGVHISGKGNAAMIRSIGYEGFAKARAGTSPGGFVIYSGSIQPILNSSEVYSGVGIELYATTSSYFKYTTSGSGLLDIRTDSFFLGSNRQFISGANGNIEISSSNFHLSPNGNVNMTGDINANSGIFKDVTIIGTVATSHEARDDAYAPLPFPEYFSGEPPNYPNYLLEAWVTASTYIGPAQSEHSKIPITFTDAGNDPFGRKMRKFKHGKFAWTGSIVNYTYDYETNSSVPESSLSFTSSISAMTASAFYIGYDNLLETDYDAIAVNGDGQYPWSGMPTSFTKWGRLVGYGTRGTDYNVTPLGNEYGYEPGFPYYKYITGSVDSVIFNVVTDSVPYTVSLLSEVLYIDGINVYQNTNEIVSAQVQLQARFINSELNWLYSYKTVGSETVYGPKMYDCKFTIDIYNGNDELLVSDSRMQESEYEWMDFNIPITALLLKNKTKIPQGAQGAGGFEYVANRVRIKLSWQLIKHTLPIGYTEGPAPKQIRLTELRIVDVPTAIGLKASSINFSDSYLSSMNSGTAVQGNLIPVDDSLYDLGSSDQNPLTGDNEINITSVASQKRWNNIYGKFLSADNAISIGTSITLQPTGSIASGYKSIAAGVYSNAAGIETITGRKIRVNNNTDENIYDWNVSPGDYYISTSDPTYDPGTYEGADFTNLISTGSLNILTIGNGPSYNQTNPYIQKDIVTCTEARVISQSWYESGLRYTTIFHLEVSSSFSNSSVPYTEDIVYIIQLNSTNGLAAHSEGQYTVASGVGSHAEGLETIALGIAAHAEGQYTYATGNGSHAEGAYNRAIGYGSHAEGVGSNSEGEYSHAEGVGTRALELGSHTEGFGTIASGAFQTVVGQYNIPSSDRSVFIIGNGYQVLPNNNSQITRRNLIFASGSQVQITGSLKVSGSVTITGSFAQGQAGNKASGIGSHAEGYLTEAIGYGSHAEGGIYFEDDNGTYSLLGGIAEGAGSHAEGGATVAVGYGSHAEGYATSALGEFSHAEGGYIAYGGGEIQEARGGGTAQGHGSHAEGLDTLAIGYGSHAEGGTTTATGVISHAEGNFTEATGDGSHAEGLGTAALGNFQHVQGQYNISSSAQSAFILGNGISNSTRSNLIFASGSQVQITGSLLITGSATLNNVLQLTSRTTTPTLTSANAGTLFVSGASSTTGSLYFYDGANIRKIV